VLVKLTNQPREYSWGSRTLIPDALAIEATGRPMAEIWFGTHPRSEAMDAETGLALSQTIGHALSFMMKFLAADYPLSIQLHPNEPQAVAGFEAENAMGIELDDSARNFRDHHAKRETLVALTRFDALVGFLPTHEIEARLAELGELVSEASASLLKRYATLLGGADGHRALVGDILAGDNPSAIQLGLLEELCALAVDSARHIDVPLIARLTGIFGTDRGVLIALMMKRVQLAPGEALFVATGVPHCYLEGLAIETMTSSDNVLRGGLTEKHVSAADFMAMLDTSESLDCAPSQATVLLRGLERYDFGSTDFSLHRIQVGGSNLLIDFGLPGESLLLCVEGELAISNSLDERLVLRRGEAAYLSADANFYSISGSGAGYLGSAA
jgi:mannose-6-phosphate isomerase